jgi:predicted methyltransferase
MNPAIISALAALGGSSVGALAPVLSNFVLQRSVTQRDLLNRQISQRETLYSDFINEASRIYAKSVTNNLEEMDELVSLYALVSRIRLMASEPVVRAAEAFVKLIVTHYGEPNLTVEQIRSAALSAKAEPLDVFSLACRKELRMILKRGELSATIGS